MAVYQNSGPGFGEALVGGIDAFRTARRQKKQDELFEEDLARRLAIQNADLASKGIHLLGKNDVLPFDVSTGLARQDSETAKRALPQTLPGLNEPLIQQAGAPPASAPAGGMPPVATPIPSRAAAGRSNIPGQSQGGSFMDRLTAMVGAPARGPRYGRGNGYYIDHQPQWDAEDAGAARSQAAKMFELELGDLFAQRGEGRRAQTAADAAAAANTFQSSRDQAARDFQRDQLGRTQDFTAQQNALNRASAERAAAARASASRAAASIPKPNEFSAKAALVYPRAQQAAALLDEFYQNGAPAESMLSHVPLVGNYLQSDTSQRMNQAAETVASAILRLESGAAITENEIKRYAQQFLPQPGDSPQVRQQKRATLATQLQRLEAAARPSLSAEASANPWRQP